MVASDRVHDAAGPDEPAASLAKHVCFRLHGQELALAIGAVKETMAVPPITRVFLTPPCFAGIINLRGDVVAVLDLARLLGLPATALTSETRVVICRPSRDPATTAGEALCAGILVDELTELRALDPARIEPPPPTLSRTTAALLAGVVMTDRGTPLQVLDATRLFACDQVRVFQREAS